MPDEGEPSTKRAKGADADIIDLTGDDDDVEPAAAPPNAPPPPPLQAPPPPAPATGTHLEVEDASPAVPDCPPLHLFRTQDIPEWANDGFLGVTLGELVSGPIQWAMAMTFLVEFPWLLTAVPVLSEIPELVFVHGQGAATAATIAAAYPNAVVHRPWVPGHGCHHTKGFILYYKGRGMRVIISSSNLHSSNCNRRTQALWYQDFGLKDAGSPGNSSFERDLADYVGKLRLPAAAAARALELISLHDFSPARVHLIGSVPSPVGGFTGTQMTSYGHLKLRRALSTEAFDPKFAQDSRLVAQSSSIGSLKKGWLQDFADSLAGGRIRGCGVPDMPRADLNTLHLIWPTEQEVRDSMDGWFAGSSFPPPLDKVTRDFLMQRYCAFGGAPAGRQRALPHLKSYLRYLEGLEGEIAWMCIGSHNLSTAAWGKRENSNERRCQLVIILSFELGVLLVPSLELQYRKSRWYGFSCTDLTKNGAPMAGVEGASAVRLVQWQRGQPQEASVADGVVTVPLPVPYELSPKKYVPGDVPWASDGKREGMDARGMIVREGSIVPAIQGLEDVFEVLAAQAAYESDA